jgi:RND family efflux transporter MFP subunit
MNPVPPLSLTPLASLPTKSVAPPRAINGAPKRRPGRGRWIRYLVKGTIVLVVATGLGWGGRTWLWPSDVAIADVLGMVTRGDLDVTVSEKGELESSKTITVKCEVEVEQIRLISIVPEGTRVKQGDEVVRFDADKLKRSLAEQEIKYKQAEAKAEAARQEVEVQNNKNDSEIAKAKLALTLADLDLEKYIKGEYQADVDDKNGLIKLAERELQDAEEKLKYYRTFVKNGFGTPEQLRLKQLEVDRARNNLDRDKAKLMVLETFTRKRQEAELYEKAAEAKRELQRTANTSKANIAKAVADRESAEVVAKLEKEQLERAQRQMDCVVVKAPEDGIVVYAQTRWWDASTRIQPGNMVSFQQPIFKLPELDKMQVKVKIHESKVKKIQKGQKAEIRVDAYPNKVLTGTVLSVATLADGGRPWMPNAVKEFETIITVDAVPAEASLKPGMSAEVGIKANYLSNVTMVPVQAVAERAGQHVVYVSAGRNLDRRDVTVGETNEKFVEIKAGLEVGEQICLDARARSAAEMKGEDPKASEDKATAALVVKTPSASASH